MEEKIQELLQANLDIISDHQTFLGRRIYGVSDSAKSISSLFKAFISFLNKNCAPVFGSADQWHLFDDDGEELLINQTQEDIFQYWLDNIYNK